MNRLDQRLDIQGGVLSITGGAFPAAFIKGTISGYWPGHYINYPIHLASEMVIIDRNVNLNH